MRKVHSSLLAAWILWVIACGGGQTPGLDIGASDLTGPDTGHDPGTLDPGISDEGRDIHDAAAQELAETDAGKDLVGDVEGDAPPDASSQPCRSDDDCEAATIPPCHALRCDLETFTCVMVPLDDQSPCVPLSACETRGLCRQGICEGEPLDCNDRNPCTEDLCNPAVGCQYVAVEGSCDDGNECTVDDRCVDGTCLGTPTIACACSEDPDCAPFEDRDLCNGTLRCLDSRCQIDLASVVFCDDSEDTFCRVRLCRPETGQCEWTPVHEGEACDDGNACTVEDRCIQGECHPGNPAVCEDYNPCTEASCDVIRGCVFAPISGPCNDGNACTEGDECISGLCQGTPILCDDRNPCTLDQCDPQAGCLNEPAEGPCDDGDVCTVGDSCKDGVCQHGGEPLYCDDGNDCTEDLCHPLLGCAYRNRDGETCDDDNACTEGERCQGGRCTGGILLSCDDNNPCTEEFCDPSLGCMYFPQQGNPCDDQNICTVGDVCIAGEKCEGVPVTCNDGNPCTEDSCDPATGCVFSLLPDESPCEDGNACTMGDACRLGRCIPGPARTCPSDQNPCTLETCIPTSGECFSVPVPGPCDDGDRCTLNDRCENGTCIGGSENLSCDDANPCTEDLCDPRTGCLHEPLDDQSPCDDGNACTTSDRCVQGVCVGEGIQCPESPIPCTRYVCRNPDVGCQMEVVEDGTPCNDGNRCTLSAACLSGICLPVTSVSCDDGNACTNDVCDPSTGDCFYRFNTEPCDDHNACTSGDRCDGAGHCGPGGLVFCNDNNVCTDDFCDPTLGCIFHPNQILCNDGNACTIADRCQDGVCTGISISCDDNNVCTNDFCDPETGCQHEGLPAGSPCDDGNLCTTNDTCDNAGRCIGGPPPNCDDGNVCTNDSCDPQTGCRHLFNTVACDDGNACTVNDRCGNGICSGQPINCSNDNPCLLPGCDPRTGCFYQAVPGVPCSDGNACTVNDQCTPTGICQGQLVNPDDGNSCTQDSCDPNRGIVRTPLNGGSCRLPVFPRLGTCSNGVCVSFCAVSCSADNNDCTYDWCTGATCRHEGIEAVACSDGNSCTTADRCGGDGLCNGLILLCDDQNPCTEDSCSQGTGTAEGCRYNRLQNGVPCPGGTCWFGVCLPL